MRNCSGEDQQGDGEIIEPDLMPLALARTCSTVGCAEFQPCPVHDRTLTWEQGRGSAARRGYGTRWTKYRRWFMDELFRQKVPRAGLCGSRLPGTPQTSDSRCALEGLIVLGTLVDHIVPVTGPDDPGFYDPLGHQLLCGPCHQAKRRRERRIA